MKDTIFNYEGIDVEDLSGDIKEIIKGCPHNLDDDEKEYVLLSLESGFYRYCLEFVYKKSMNVLRSVINSAGETIANKMAYVMEEGSLLGISDIFILSLASRLGLIDQEDRLNLIKLAELLQAQNRKLNVGNLSKELVSQYLLRCFNYVFYKDYSKFSESMTAAIEMLTKDKLIPLSEEYITIVGTTDNEKTILVRLLFVLLFEMKRNDEVFIHNFKLLIPVLWENLSMSDKIYLSLYLKKNETSGYVKEVLEEIHSHIKIPDFSTDVKLVKHVFINGQDSTACHFSLNNTRSEVSALLNIRDNIYVPAMFSRNVISPAVLAYVGNAYGHFDEAKTIAKDILYNISNDKWVYFFKHYFKDAHILIKLFYSQKTALSWCELVREYIEDIEEDIPDETVRNIITLSKKGDVDEIRRICKALYNK